MAKRILAGLIAAFLAATVATLVLWNRDDVNPPTGDELHYLVMANGLGKLHSFDQTEAYRLEFINREFFAGVLVMPDAEPSIDDTHTVKGPHGVANVHNFGLPLLLTVPVWLGGLGGARFVMVLCALVLVLVLWKVSGLFTDRPGLRGWSVATLAVAAPFIPAAAQIYPDLLAGVLALLGLYWLHTVERERPRATEWLLTACVACLPWLQIKYAFPALILLGVITWKIIVSSSGLKRPLAIVSISAVSFLVLAFYNWYMFGDVTGPYQSNALEVSRTSGMVLVGLFLDQNHGFLFQNPVFFIGVAGVGGLWRFSRSLTLTWAAVFSSLIVLNALHTNWYGGYSFSGRFAWSATIVFALPTLFGLVVLAQQHRRVFRGVVALAALFQVHLFWRYAVQGVSLYRREAGEPFERYSIYFQQIRRWLPALYDADWAYGWTPNYVWLGITVLVFVWGIVAWGARRAVPTNDAPGAAVGADDVDANDASSLTV